MSRKEGMGLFIPPKEKGKKKRNLWDLMVIMNTLVKRVAKYFPHKPRGMSFSSGDWYVCDETSFTESDGTPKYYGGVLCWVPDNYYLRHHCVKFLMEWKFYQSHVERTSTDLPSHTDIDYLPVPHQTADAPKYALMYHFLMDKTRTYDELQEKLPPCALALD